MFKRFSWILTLPVIVVVVIFAVRHRADVAIDLWPTGIQLAVPLYVVVLGSLLTGFLVGALVMWLSAGRGRRRARASNHQARSLEYEVARLKQPVAAPPPPAARAGTGESHGAPAALHR